jgi:hypothetical protein
LTIRNELVLCRGSLEKEQEKTRRNNDVLPAMNGIMNKIRI